MNFFEHSFSKDVSSSLDAEALKTYARSIGIDLIGITPAVFDEVGERRLHDFIVRGRHGNMEYLEEYKKRVSPETLLPGAKSVIVIGINYYREPDPKPTSGVYGKVARYAYGRDYHKVLKKLLKKIEVFFQEHLPGEKCKICVDSSPLLEKSYAVRAGLGFIGKNTTLITKEFGSFVLLGEILTTAAFDYDEAGNGTCGTCTRCITSCPTQAIVGPGELDARRCISYLTIEEKGPIPDEFKVSMGEWIFGCDICQEVCPYNKVNAKPLQLEAFKEVKIAGSWINTDEVLKMEHDDAFLQRFAGSPVMRAKRKGLQRNAKIVRLNR